MSNGSSIEKKVNNIIKKDMEAKKLLQNPPEFTKQNVDKIKKWIVDLANLLLYK